jgi:predicted negative regulator of RcsB-dependent stress response
VEQYRTEEEQVEALRRWWDENGRSIIIAVVVALAGVFGWRSWQDHSLQQNNQASDIYQSMLQVSAPGQLTEEQRTTVVSYAEQLKSGYGNSTYAQFAALQLARAAVDTGELDEAEAELRWVLGKADKGSDMAQVTELRLARVVAAQGELEQALAIIDQADQGPYSGAYEVAKGDILMSLGRDEEAREAFARAQLLGAAEGGMAGMSTLQQKLQSLTPIPARESEAPSPVAAEIIESEVVAPDED